MSRVHETAAQWRSEEDRAAADEDFRTHRANKRAEEVAEEVYADQSEPQLSP